MAAHSRSSSASSWFAGSGKSAAGTRHWAFEDQSFGATEHCSRRKKPRLRPVPAPDWREDLVRAGAPVAIVKFFDYQCPFCLKANPALEETIRKRPGKVRLVLKHLPLASHPDSVMAHQAALAAWEHGHFWEMHDLLFANQKKIKT